MKRFFLYSLSATVALTVGTAARADIYENNAEMDGSPTEGVISPDSNEPNNRAIPESGVTRESSTASDSEVLTEGIIVPNSNEPSNRAMPDRGALEYDAPSEANPAPTEGIIVPNSNEPSNRAIPNEGLNTRDAENSYDEVYDDYREPTTNEYPSDRNTTDSAPTDGVISPDSDGPNNRATPQEGALESDGMMPETDDAAPTEGIISPDSDGPNNRVDVDRDPATVDGDRNYNNDETSPVEGIISPDSDGPNNTVTPGM